jgi:hypothetical protein
VKTLRSTHCEQWDRKKNSCRKKRDMTRAPLEGARHHRKGLLGWFVPESTCHTFNAVERDRERERERERERDTS